VHIATEWTLDSKQADVAPEAEENKAHCDIDLLSYWGNGNDISFEDCHGAVIWDENGDVLGQFRFQEPHGRKLAFARV
jgi:hypothetical protein